MAATTYPPRSAAEFGSLPRTLRAFVELAEMVRSFQPDVVILVARKMPHLISRLSLDFGDTCLVMSDLAIPFAHRLLRGARVAVIDDMVNVGSTLDRACEFVRNCGADEVGAFSVGFRAQSRPQTTGLRYVIPEPLADDEYAQHTRAVPRVISELARPYDLSFPVLSCRLQPGFGSAEAVHEWLAAQHGAELVTELTSGHARSGIRRFAVNMPCEGGMAKVRLFVDEPEGCCNVVPFFIPPHLDEAMGPALSSWPRTFHDALLAALENAPRHVALWPGEPAVRASMFAHALNFGLRVLETWGDIVAAITPEAVSMDDATMLFGPVVRSIWRRDDPVNSVPPLELRVADTPHRSVPSPFLAKFPVEELVSAAREQMQAHSLIRNLAGEPVRSDLDLYQGFNALFDQLAASVASDEPGRYQLNWPYPQEEVRRDAYLRLRIGPTYDDLLELLRMLVPHAAADPLFDQWVSTLVDRGVDAGSVVPTLAQYDGRFYRIYRRGESDPTDVCIDRLCYAVQGRKKAMSLTRIAKIDAILAFSRAHAGTTIARAIERGNVGALPASILDDPHVDAASYARNIGRLQPAEHEHPA